MHRPSRAKGSKPSSSTPASKTAPTTTKRGRRVLARVARTMTTGSSMDGRTMGSLHQSPTLSSQNPGSLSPPTMAPLAPTSSITPSMLRTGRSVQHPHTPTSQQLTTATTTTHFLHPLDTEPESESSGSGFASDSPFIVHHRGAQIKSKPARRASTPIRDQASSTSGGEELPSSSSSSSPSSFSPLHHTTGHSAPGYRSKELQKQLHTRKVLKDIRHKLTSFPAANKSQPTRPADVAVNSMNDEDRRADDLIATEIEMADGDESSNESSSSSQRALDLPLQDDSVPDPSQLTRHFPDIDFSTIANNSDEPIKAKIHPLMRRRIEAAQKLAKKQDAQLKNILEREKEVTQSQQFKDRFKYTDPLKETVEEFDDSKDDDTQTDDDEDETPQPPPGACTIEEAMECVVKIFVTQSLPNFLQPWQKRPSSDHMGSGFVIKGKRIVTNAHVVADALVVMVRRPGSSRKTLARVVASAHECDLALLEVEDESFWGPGATSIDFEQGTIGVDNSHPNPSSPAHHPQHQPLHTKPTRKKTPGDSSDDTGDDNYDDQDDVDLARNGGSGNPSDPAPDLPGVGPGSVGSPWWTSLAPDAPRRKPKHNNNNTLMLKDDNVNVPTFTTTTPFIKEQGSLYVSPAMPGLQSSVVVIGYPLGGDNVSITQGVVSRIEPTTYAHTGTYLLAIQIDAAINPGNSGGPALSIDGRVIGVAFQNITNASNVGYIIPAPVIIHFLRDVQRGAYRITKRSKENMRTWYRHKTFSQDPQTKINTPLIPPETAPGTDQRFFTPYLSGFPSIGLFCQETTSESLRDYIGLSSCTKLTPVDPVNHEPNVHPGFTLLDAVAELRRYREFKNHQALDTPVQHFQRLRQYQIEAANLAAKSVENTPIDLNSYRVFDYETTTIPAAYSHYYMLEQHIKEDVRRKRQLPLIEHGINQVGVSEPNKVLTLVNNDYEINRNENHPFGLNHQGKNSVVHIKQRYNKSVISGVLVSEVSALSAFHKLVFPGDVLLSVDGHELGSDGSVHFRGHERIAFDHLTSLKHNSQIIQLTILRRKKDKSANAPTLENLIGGPNSMFSVTDIPSIAAKENSGLLPSIDSDDEVMSDDHENYHTHHDEGLQYKDKHKFDRTKVKKQNANNSTTTNNNNTNNNNNNTDDNKNDQPTTPSTTTNTTLVASTTNKKKLKLKTRAPYQNRIVAPCDSCSKDIQIPPYNATYYQNIHEVPAPQPDPATPPKPKVREWNTALGLSADFIYTKQNNPVLKEIIKSNLERMTAEANQVTPSPPTSSTPTTPATLPPPLPNGINSPAHYTRLPLNYTKTHHLGKQLPNKYKIPSTSSKHMLCVHDDLEVLTIKAPVSILPSTSPNVYDRGTSYVFFGGLLFVPLSYQYTKDVGNDAPLQLTFARCAPLSSHDEEKVVLAQVLQDNETVGYPYLDRPISHICGVPVRNMKGLLEAIHTKSVTASVSNLVKSTLLQHPQDLPLLIHMLQNNNSVDYVQHPHFSIPKKTKGQGGEADGEDTLIYNITPEAQKRCKDLYDILCSLSDILCSETDVETYTGSLLKIYNSIPSQSPWKRYLLQVLDMYLYPNDLTPVPRTSSLSQTTHDTFVTEKGAAGGHSHNHAAGSDSSNTNKEQYQYSTTTQVSNHIHREHNTPTKQALLALFDEDIRKYPLGSIPTPFIKPETDNPPVKPPTPFSPIDFLPFKPHTMTVQTTENKLITLDMERAIGAHYRLKETLNI